MTAGKWIAGKLLYMAFPQQTDKKDNAKPKSLLANLSTAGRPRSTLVI
jgi:hypothetical protein